MVNSPKGKAKKVTTKPEPKKVSELKVTTDSKITKKVAKSKVASKTKVVPNPTIKPELKEAVAKIVDKKIAEEKKVETKKKAFLEPGFKSVSLIALVIVLLFAVLILLWEFALPSKYKLSTVVSDSKIERIILRADKLVSNDTFDVAVVEPCNIAIRYDKTKYTANIGVTKNGSFGVYKEPFARIFENKDVDIYEFSLTEKDSKNPKAAVIACLDAGLKKNLTVANLNDITDTLSEKIPTSFTKVANDIKELTFFNETSKKYIGKNLFQKIRLLAPQNPNLDVSNTFVAFDNKLLFLASQNTPMDIELQVNSINPSEPSFDTKTVINEYKDANKALTEKINKENEVLKFDQNKDFKVEMDIANFGKLNIDLSEKYGPKTVENFLRLAYRGYYNDTIFHRMVKRDNFNVIQGGDKENKNGTGGQSAFYLNKTSPGIVPDEIWKVAPEFKTSEAGENESTNTPEFRAPDLYKNYDNKTGIVTYPKGTIAMATTGQPDSASSQFFIILDDTQLPAEYTIFGKVSDNSMMLLEKILKEVSPTPSAEAGPQSGKDGIPNKELKINTIKITQPQI